MENGADANRRSLCALPSRAFVEGFRLARPASTSCRFGDEQHRRRLGEHSAEKRQAYNIARRSCGEVRSMSYVLLDNKFVASAAQQKLLTRCIHTGKLISGLIRSLGNR
ncbi:MAG: hypothetical protein DME24_22880 [Verrucomicrobia bacterium]|nr:MAG: hypothetical protein DME24_22880 [Verrucomicrobiota bacterium]